MPAAIRPVESAIKELISTAGVISNGDAAPAAARTDAMVVGRSWMEAVFMTTSIHSSSEARPPARRAMPFAALIPAGVAAFPRPRRLALTFSDREDIISSSREQPGNSRDRRGDKSRDSPADMPHCCISSITALHRQRLPVMLRQKLTAAWAPSITELPAAAVSPLKAAARLHARYTTKIINPRMAALSFQYE